MTRKKFRIFMAVFMILSVSVLSGLMIVGLKDRNKSGAQTNPSSAVNGGVTENFQGSDNKQETGFSFYINESAAKKTKTTTNDITTFVLETKLFITNKSASVATIDPDAFVLSYDTNGTGLLYSIEYGEIEKPIVLEGKSTTAINFVVKYLIQDVENFNDHQKHTLTINYIGEQILVCSV